MNSRKLILTIPLAGGLVLSGCAHDATEQEGDVEQKEADPQEPDLDEEPSEEGANN
ncbi:hypothetical protein ACFO3D_08430 [Virgibacillus kekensis]|uniref:Lipoprotein n=1 Tax=Virgibacillus kekensis TaxID=202261 RepID=A0ABV9DKX4_9BACI